MEAESRAKVRDYSFPIYSPVARTLHWLTVVLVAVQIPVGLYMVWRGSVTNFDAVTNTLYSAHKLNGFVILWLVVIRIVYRLVHGAPADEPTIEWWHRVAAHANHWGLYALLILVPLLGWLGVSYFGALGTFFGISLPAIAEQNSDRAALVFRIHFWGAMLILAFVAVHVAAALYHYFIRRDGVLLRMLPSLKQRR